MHGKKSLKAALASNSATSKDLKILLEAKRFIQQENYAQAIRCYKQLAQNPERSEQIHLCQMQLLRRFAKQGKSDQFITAKESYGWKEHLALPLARIQGEAALEELAKTGQGVDAELAGCCLEKDLKTALIRLRKLPLYKEMAEGWICLLKGNFALSQSAFESAQHKVPHAARIGLALCTYAQGQVRQAQASMEPLRKALSHGLPKLAQAMGWKGIHEERFRTLFYGSATEIETALKEHPYNLSRDMLGYLHLRVGDLLWSAKNNHNESSWERILSHWKNASKLCPSLTIDFNKRFLFFAYKKLPDDFVEEVWWELCLALYQKDPKQLNAYLLYNAYLPDNELPPIPLTIFQLSDAQEWILANSLSPFHLLLCRLIVRNLRLFENCLQIPSLPTDAYDRFIRIQLDEIEDDDEDEDEDDDEDEDEDDDEDTDIETFSPWDVLKSALPLLDHTYQNEPLYLKARYILARLLQDAAQMRSVTYYHLLNSPEQKAILIPRYVAALFQEFKSELQETFLNVSLSTALHRLDNHAEILQQLIKLHAKFPDDYDVARLVIACRYDNLEARKRVVTHAGHLTRPLANLLQCQVLIDTGETAHTVARVLPEWEACQGNPDAQERWLQIVCSPLLQTQERWHVALKTLSDETLHRMLKQMTTREGMLLPLSFINALKKKMQMSYMQYHEAVQGLHPSQAIHIQLAAFRQLEQYLETLDNDHPDFNNIFATLRVFSAVYGMEKISDS